MLCRLCPRKCGVDRETHLGFCKLGTSAVVSKVMLHLWEEPCICFGAGSGAVFFSGCQLQCIFCQNHEISRAPVGKTVDSDGLADIFLQLEEKGACNVNLVSPTPHLETVIPALNKAKKRGLSLPVVFNSGGYETAETVKRLEGLVDIYLPDFKFSSSSLSRSYAMAENYRFFAEECLREMYRQTGKIKWGEKGLERGIIVRHLILPGHTQDSAEVLKAIAHIVPPKDVILSLLRQYTPTDKTKDHPTLKRRITSLEYQKVVSLAEEVGFEELYTQEKESASAEYIPNFNEKTFDKPLSE